MITSANWIDKDSVTIKKGMSQKIHSNSILTTWFRKAAIHLPGLGFQNPMQMWRITVWSDDVASVMACSNKLDYKSIHVLLLWIAIS